MAYCYFNKDYLKTYNCEYEIKEDKITIEVDFGNADESMIKSVLSIENSKYIEAETISLIDSKNNFYIKTFYAFESHRQTTFGFPYVRAKKSYYAKSYIKAYSEKELDKLDKNIKLDNMIFYHECLDLYLQNKLKDINFNYNPLKYVITLDNNVDTTISLKVKKNNIKTAKIISDYSFNSNFQEIKICYKNKLRLDFKTPISFEDAFKYKNLVTIMFNIYYTTESLPYLTGFYIGKSFYEFVWDKTNYNPSYNNNIKNKVSYDLDKYIEAFLNTFKTKMEDINLLTPFKKRGQLYAEDTFLTFYRFAELVEKNKNGNKDWLTKLYKDNKSLIVEMGLKYNAQVPIFMETLRNHYVHEGYFIKSNMLKLKDGKGKKKRVTNEIIVNFSRIVKALAFKIMLNDILKLNIPNKNIISII